MGEWRATVNDWLNFVRGRLAQLMRPIFVDGKASAADRLAFRFYHEELNRLGFGCDYSQLPQLQLPILDNKN